MSEREPYTPDQLRERRATARRQRRQKKFRRARNTVLGTAGAGLAIATVKVGLHKQDAVERHAAQEAAPLVQGMNETKAANEARERAWAAEAQQSAGQSGEVDVSEAGVTGYVELDSETPDDMTTVVPGGVSADRDPGTGGVSAGDSAG